MKFLASILWAFLALVVTGGIAVATSLYFFPLQASKLDMAAGEAHFNENCSGCHAKVAGQVAGLGPNLHAIGLEAGERVEGQSGADYILESIFYPEKVAAPGSNGAMPSGTVSELEPPAIRNLVAYLSSLGASVDYGELAALEIKVPDEVEATETFELAEIRDGWHLFSRELGCIACHTIYSEPGSSLVAPSLERASQLPADYVLESIKEPSAQIADSYRQRTYSLENGETVGGRLQSETDTDYLVYGIGADGKGRRLHSLQKSQITSVETSDLSTMPPYSLSEEQERNLLAFFHSLQGEGN